MKKILTRIIYLLLVLFILYLLLPSPKDPPSLPNSVKSTEPLDTWQKKDIFAYYTNMSRKEVIEFYQQYYSNSKLFNIPLITYRLNHPPEYAREVIIDTIPSSFFEEIIHPFREAWFLNGYEPENDPFNSTGTKFGKHKIDGKEYSLKITVYKKGSSQISRTLIFLAVLISAKILFPFFRKTYEDIRHNR